MKKSAVALVRVEDGIELFSFVVEASDLQWRDVWARAADAAMDNSFNEIVVVVQMHMEHQIAAALGFKAPGGSWVTPQELHRLSAVSSTGRSRRSSLPGEISTRQHSASMNSRVKLARELRRVSPAPRARRLVKAGVHRPRCSRKNFF